jgi:hypothetical protein
MRLTLTPGEAITTPTPSIIGHSTSAIVLMRRKTNNNYIKPLNTAIIRIRNLTKLWRIHPQIKNYNKVRNKILI